MGTALTGVFDQKNIKRWGLEGRFLKDIDDFRDIVIRNGSGEVNVHGESRFGKIHGADRACHKVLEPGIVDGADEDLEEVRFGHG
jgi:hypothetical protein